MRIFQCVALTALLAVANSQYYTGSYLPPRGRGVSDSALYKFLSAVRGGGRGHRELLSLTSSGSNPYASYQSAPSSGFSLPFFGRAPPQVTHIPAPPKVGAFYITPPERNAPFYYSSSGVGKKPHLVKISDLKNSQGLQLIPAETSNRPRPHPLNPLMQFVHLNTAPLSSATNYISPQQGGPGPQQQQAQAAAPQPAQSNDGSLQEIIAKAAQQQHAQVLQREQKANPNAQITSQFLIPQAGPGQQPVFLNQFGQPFLAPAIYAPGQQPQNFPPQFLAGNNGQGFLIGQGPGPVPPQALLQQANLASLNSISENQEQGSKGAEQQQSPQQQSQKQQQQQVQQHQQQQLQQQQLAQLQNIQILNPGIQFGPGGQLFQAGPQRGRIPFPIGAQQIQGGHGGLFGLPQGAPHFLPGQFAVLPQQIPGLRGVQGQLIPGNAILSQPHYAVINPGQGQPQGQQGQNNNNNKGLVSSGSSLPEGKSPEKEEQPLRPHEAASQKVQSVVSHSGGSNSAQGQLQAAIMQSQLEFSEPIVKLKK